MDVLAVVAPDLLARYREALARIDRLAVSPRLQTIHASDCAPLRRLLGLTQEMRELQRQINATGRPPGISELRSWVDRCETELGVLEGLLNDA